MFNKTEKWGTFRHCPLDKIFYLDQAQAAVTRNLWKHCFPDDSDGFLDYYYGNTGNLHRILIGEVQKNIVSMLHRNSYTVVVKGREMCLDYIVAVGTLRSYRGLGCMGKVLTTALNDMNREGRPFTYLMPAAEAIYTPYDFRFVGKIQKAQLREDGNYRIKMIPVQSCHDHRIEAAKLMNRWIGIYDVHTRRDEAYVEHLLRELASENGHMYFLEKDREKVGLFAQWGLVQKEQRLLYAPQSLLENISMDFQIMARITNVETFLPMFGVFDRNVNASSQIVMHISDPWIPQNNGRFLWTLGYGKSKLTALGQAVGEQLHAAELTEPVPEIQVTISELALWLFGCEDAQSLWRGCSRKVYDVLNRVDRIHGVYIDEVV